MDPIKFLKEIQTNFNDSEFIEELVIGSVPRILAQYKGYFIKVDFVNTGELILEVNTIPPHFLMIRPTSWLAKFLPFMFPDIEVGDHQFDEKYMIQNASSDKVEKTLTPEIRKILEKIAPFVTFEMTNKEYRIYKYVDLDYDYTIEKGMEDIDNLIKIVEIIKSIWGVSSNS